MAHGHDLEPEYLHAADARVRRLYEGPNGKLHVSIAIPCPECDEVIALEAPVESSRELDIEVPLSDADIYD